MNLLGIALPSSPGSKSGRAGFFVLSTALVLTLSACGGAGEETTSSEGQNQAESAAGTANTSEENLTENFAGAEALAEADEVGTDAQEVQTTEQLYTDIQDALAKIEPVTATGEEANTGDEMGGNTEDLEAEQAAEEPEYVSPEVTAQLEEAAVGGALDQYLATAMEYAQAGWRVEGSSKVVGSPKLAEGDYQGQAAKILEVCLDSSDVKVLDQAGNTVSSDQHPRSLNIFTLVEEGGSWKIASHDFPNDADC